MRMTMTIREFKALCYMAHAIGYERVGELQLEAEKRGIRDNKELLIFVENQYDIARAKVICE